MKALQIALKVFGTLVLLTALISIGCAFYFFALGCWKIIFIVLGILILIAVIILLIFAYTIHATFVKPEDYE